MVASLQDYYFLFNEKWNLVNVWFALNFNLQGNLLRAIKYLITTLLCSATSSSIACKPGGSKKFIKFEKEDANVGVSREKDIAL